MTKNRRYLFGFPNANAKGVASNDEIATTSVKVQDMPDVAFEIPEIPNAPEIEIPEHDQPSFIYKFFKKLIAIIVALIMFFTGAMLDDIKERIKPLSSSIVDMIVGQYPFDNKGSNDSN